MAASLDGLIRHLLDQIALCGEHGASPLDFITHVKGYYHHPIQDSPAQDRDHALPHPRITSNVDRPFLEQVWRWLIKNPEIRLGSQTGHKRLTLSEVEARNAAIEHPEQSIPVSQKTDPPKAVVPSHASDAPTIVQVAHVNQIQRSTQSASARTKNAGVPQETKFNPGIRLYASKNRMWHALTGHGPDFSKVKSLDFICLSIIAACGPKGILQHDLVRISGQDKRSLPARTDRLHDDGYVEKKRVSVQLFNPTRLLHTSQCTLKRFINRTLDQKQSADDPIASPPEKAKRVKKKRQRDRDSQAPAQSSATVITENVSRKTSLAEGRAVPSWTVDRSVNNQIFELVHRAGIKGMSMTEIRDNLMGDYIKKPLDEYVSRLVQCWQISQPLHIRHLSIVRDTVLKGKTQIYMYYTYENFKKLVEGGTGFWEAVTTIPSEVKIDKNSVAALDAKPDVDEYGFPKLEANQFQGLHNDATLEDCVSALKVDPLHISVNDPVIEVHADGTHGVWYKSHQQHSVNTSNGSRPKKATSTPSQAASVRAQVTEPQKVVLSLPSGSVSIESHEEKLAMSKPSMVPARGLEVGSQFQRRRNPKKLDSKPVGRPRKWPKTGIPANFDTLTPDEVDLLYQSQEMFEKYELVRIEKEIVRRIDDGENAVKVAYEVLAEWDNSRKQEGELPLRKTSKAQVLHDFAGEPMPEIDLDEARLKGRPRKDTRYWPSMAANTYFVPALQKQAHRRLERKDPEEGPSILPTRTRRRGKCVSGLESMIYLPSIAAHSWPYVPLPSLATEISAADRLQNSTKRKQGRPAKPKQLRGPRFNYLPSVAAHSGSCLPLDTLTMTRAGQKRKRTVNTLLENDEEHKRPLQYKYLPSIAAHSGSFLPPDATDLVRAGQKRKRVAYMVSEHDEHHTPPNLSSPVTQRRRIVPVREASLGTSNMQLSPGNKEMYPGWKKFMSKTYQQQLETIERSNAGIFIGKTMPRRKRPCEPRDFRPTHFKLAIFKSTRLTELDWSVKRAIASEQRSAWESKAQTPTSKVVEPATQSPPEGQLDLLESTFQPPPASFDLISQPISSYISPYAEIAGAKRKRTISPRPTRSAAPFDPFSASPYSRLSSPTTDFSKPLKTPSTLPEAAPLSPAIDHVAAKSIVQNEAPARTPESRPDTQESSESTSNAPVPNNPNPTQNAIIIEQIVQSSQSPTREANEPSRQPSISKISRRGGSAAMLRKNIIMEIVEKCEGVFPSHKEMSSPFAAEWKRRGQEGTPEAKTISNAVNALIKETKLRQITFTAQTRQGFAVTKNMLTLPNVDIANPKVKEVQTNMAAYHPRYYVPMAVLPPQNHQSIEIHGNTISSEEASGEKNEGVVEESSSLEALELRRLDLGKKMMDGKERAALAWLKAIKQKDQQGPGRADGDEPSTEPPIERASIYAAYPVSGPGRDILAKATPKRSGGQRGQKRVERLASIKKYVPSQMTPLPPMHLNSVSHPVSLTWLPSNYAFSDLNFEEQRPTVLMAAARNGLQIGTPEVPVPLGSSDNAKRRIREMAANTAEIERRQPLASSARSSLLPTDLTSGLLESPYASTRPPSPPRHAPVSRVATLRAARRKNQPLPYTSIQAWGPNFDETVRPGDNLGPENISLQETRQLHPTLKILPPGSLSATASLSPRSPSSCVSGWPAFAHAEDSGKLNQRALLVSFMDPVHYFHRATGTFSVTFSGLRPARKILGHRRTAPGPYATSLKVVQPYSPDHRTIWPSSLQESSKTKKTLFDEEVDSLLRRELEENDLNSVLLAGWPFVNHVFSHVHQTVQTVEADMEAAKQVFVRLTDGRLISRSFSRNDGSRPRTINSIFSTGRRGIDLAVAESQAQLKRRRLTSVVELETQDDNSNKVGLDHEHRPAKLRRVRGPRHAKSLGENGEERLLTAVMVIRALTGGLDKRIDWVLVAKVFEPTYTQMFVHSRWNLTLQKYKLVLPKMESDFRNTFASAYEEGTVPALDYDNLEEYDWKWLVEWTMANVDTPTQSLPELPVERSEFDAVYTLNETSNNEINEFYEIDGSSVLSRRTKVVHKDPYVLPLLQERQWGRPDDTEDLETAKSWIRANILTPESTYNPSAARAKLSTFPDRTVEDALKQLLLDRVLTQENKGRLVPGRNYDISDFFISRLKKNLQPAHFQRAVAYKQQLDHDFEEKGFCNYSHAADDGDMIVIVNLQAHHRITVVPIDVPMNKWGQTDGGYETRQMDKRRLNFSLELRPLPTYIYGNPLSPLPAPPSQHLQDPMAKIPLWYDIHGLLVPVMWEMVLAAVVAVLAMRPGLGASELEKAIRPAVEIWELQEVLEWLVSAKAAKRVGQGFSIEEEWWWLALGTGERSEQCLGEDV